MDLYDDLGIANIDFRPAPTAGAYCLDDSFASFAIGPVGSGKTFASCAKGMRIGMSQRPHRDNIRYTRGAVVRNTMPELKTATIKTWQALWPEQRCGPMRMSSPVTHHIKRRPTASEPGLDMEVIFIALDTVRDVKKLLSTEFTWIYYNEVREIPKAIVDQGTGRVGRYPGPNYGGTTWSGQWGDTNPPYERHYLREWDMVERPHGYTFWKQPPAVLEVELTKTGVPLCKEPEYYKQPFPDAPILEAAGRLWVVNPMCENLINLQSREGVSPLSQDGYYGRQIAGKSIEWIKCYLQGRYVFVPEGKPVVPAYLDEFHSREHVPVLEDRPLELGMDIGGGTLQPSAIIGQRHPRGPWLIHAELVCFDMGLKNFAAQLNHLLATEFPKHYARLNDESNPGIVKVWGDPAGRSRDPLFEIDCFDHLRNQHGYPAEPAPTNDIKLRVQVITQCCERFVDGKPGLIINRKRCPTLRVGLNGGWHYRRMQVVGKDVYRDVPEKNDFSHPCDGLSYLLLGGGELRAFRGASPHVGQTLQADTDFPAF